MKKFKFKIRGNNYNAVIKSHEKNIIDIEINGTAYKVEVEKEAKATKTPKLVRARVHTKSDNVKIPKATSLSVVKAPLPGTIFKLVASVGDEVKIGDVLLIMEAMKMENNIMAEKSGVIKSIKVKEGDAVMQDDVLVELE